MQTALNFERIAAKANTTLPPEIGLQSQNVCNGKG